MSTEVSRKCLKVIESCENKKHYSVAIAFISNGLFSNQITREEYDILDNIIFAHLRRLKN